MRLFKDSLARVISGKAPFWTKKLNLERSNCWHKVPLSLPRYYICFVESFVFFNIRHVEICVIFVEQTVFHHQDKRMQIFFIVEYMQIICLLWVLHLSCVGSKLCSFSVKDLSHKQILDKCCELQAQMNYFIWRETAWSNRLVYDASMRFTHTVEWGENNLTQSFPVEQSSSN